MTGPKDPGRAFREERARRLAARTRILADTRAEILRLLEQARARIAQTLAAQPSDAERWLLPQLSAQIDQAMQEFAAAARAGLGSAAGAAWAAGQALIDAPLAAGGTSIEGRVPHLDTRQLLAMRAFMADRIKDVSARTANAINTELGLAVIGAQAPGEAVAKVAALFKAAPRKRAITIVRTELSRVYAVAAQERLLQAAEVVDGLGKQWRRSGKLHSRIAHDLADGQVQPAGKPFRLGNGVRLMFPHDPAAPAAETINCGCVALPWRKEWERAVANPGRKRYTDQEMAANPMKRDIQDQLDHGRPIGEILGGAKAA